MARGRYKRRRAGHLFQKGHAPCGTQNRSERREVLAPGQQAVSTHEVSGSTPNRLTYDEFHSILQLNSAAGPYLLNDYTSPVGRLLRPVQVTASDGAEEGGHDGTDLSSSELITNRIFCLQNTSDLWNEAFRQHQQYFPECQGYLQWDIAAEVQRGLGWEERLKCLSCSYVSAKRKLYQELTTDSSVRGRRAVAINRAVMVGLSHTGIGYDGFKNILITMNIPPPSMHCMQQNANIVGEHIVKLNKDDMCQTRGDIRRLSNYVGKTAIAIEGDCRYNNSLRSAGTRTLFQPATQATYTICENLTKQKKVISLASPNKLCHTASVLRGKGQDITCPNHHGSCSANIPPGHSIGDEKQWADDCLRGMGDDKMPLKFNAFTTDGDSRAFAAVLYRHPDAEQYRDPNHLAKGQKRLVMSMKFSKEFLKAADKIYTADHLQSRLASDIAYRCSAELNELVTSSEMNTDKIIRGSSYLKDAILQCILGNHIHCKKHSFVCTGSKRGCWQLNFLPPAIKLCPSDDDIGKLKTILEYRLSRAAVLATKCNKDTQKSEAVNRAYTRCNPKHITFSRNFPGRVHSAAHLANNGLAQSTMKKCESLRSPLPRGCKAVRRLISDSRVIEHKQKMCKSDISKARRAGRRRENYKMYDFCKAQAVVTYEKNRYDNVTSETRAKNKKRDHCYARLK